MNMRRSTIFASLTGLALLAVCLTANGAEDPPNPLVVKQAELRAEYVNDLTAAYQLAQFAQEHKAPEAYIAAASLLRKVDARTGKKTGNIEEKPTDEKGNPIKDEPKDGVKLAAQADAWFDDARSLVAGTKQSAAVDALIATAEKRNYDDEVKERGAAGGPKNVTRSIAPNQTQVYHFTFQTGVPAAVAMRSSGGARLRFEIVGPQGGNLFSLAGLNAGYNWIPRSTSGLAAKYIIRIHNTGTKATTYSLMTN